MNMRPLAIEDDLLGCYYLYLDDAPLLRRPIVAYVIIVRIRVINSFEM